ncbi:MAG: hypothetical protein H7143_05760 [Pseudorhodobacter sp.]|nr:hypothetical protein [Rhizobacter sp.]
MPVCTNHQGRVVVGVVSQQKSRRSGALGVSLRRRSIESVDLLTRLGREREVKRRFGALRRSAIRRSDNPNDSVSLR